MFSKVRANADPAARHTAARTEPTRPAAVTRQAASEPGSLTPGNVLQLQGAVGNQAVQRLLQAKAAGPQIQRKPRVKVSDVLDSSDPVRARQKGRELGKLWASGKWTREDSKELYELLGFFRGRARDEFIMGISEVSGDIPYRSRGKLQDAASPYGRQAVFERSLVIPVSAPRVIRGGFKVSYRAQIFEETSEATSVEVYTDASAGGELGIEVPLLKVAKFKFSGSLRGGKKWTSRSEQKETSREGVDVSRSFTIRKLSREIMRVLFTSKEYNPSPDEVVMLREMEEIKPKVADVLIYETQEGYQITPDEGGDPWVPFWNEYLGYDLVEKSAVRRVWEVLKAEQRKIAEDLVVGGG